MRQLLFIEHLSLINGLFAIRAMVLALPSRVECSSGAGNAYDRRPLVSDGSMKGEEGSDCGEGNDAFENVETGRQRR